MSLLEQFRIVVLECPYLTWENPLTQRLFSKVVSLKFRGYQNNYGSHVLPIDASDFVATHLLVCDTKNSELTPVMGFRTIELNRCRQFGLELPVVNLLKAATNAAQHVKHMEETIKSCLQSNTPLYYLSSWTIDPSLRNNQMTLVHQLTPLFNAMIFYYHRNNHPGDHPIKLFGGGAIQLRVPNVLKSLGFKPSMHNNEELPPFNAAFAKNAPILLMELNEFSQYSFKLAEKYKTMWNSRLVEDQDLYSSTDSLLNAA